MSKFKELTILEKILTCSIPLFFVIFIISLKFKGISEFGFIILGIISILFVINFIKIVFNICKLDSIKSILPQIIVAVLLIVLIYSIILLNSNRILSWDFATYYKKALLTDELFTNSFYRGIRNVMSTMWLTDYSSFVVLFTSLFFHFTSKTSNMYVVSNMIFLVVPLTIMLIAFINKITKGNKIILWISSIFISSFPFLHFTSIMGQPDIFGLFFILCIILLTFDYDFKVIEPRRLVYLFLATICLFVLRRWYAFWIVGYYFSYIIYIIVSNINNKVNIKKLMKNIFKFVGVSFLLGGIALSPMIYKILKNSYATSYEAYYRGGLSYEIINQFGKLGIFITIMIFIGLIYGIYNKELRRFTITLFSTGFIGMILFTRVQNMNNHQSLIIIPTYIFMIIISLLCINKIQKYLIKTLIFISVSVFFIANFLSSFLIEDNKNLLFTNVSIKPIVRQDMDEIKEVVDFIQENCDENNKILIISSTQEYNTETFKNYLLPKDNLEDKIYPGFSVDLVHGFPVGALEGKYILISDPLQLGVTAQSQKLINTIVDAINNNENVKNHFKYIKTFSMGTGVDFKLYERVSKADEKECNYYVDTFNQWYSKYPSLYEKRIIELMKK